MHDDKKRCNKNRRRSIRVIGGLISIKKDGNNKNKNRKKGKNHGDEVSQVGTNQNNKPKMEHKREE